VHLEIDLINGVAVGLEYVEPIEEEGFPHSVIVDLLIIRLLFQWH
jgi:hypothetical protein